MTDGIAFPCTFDPEADAAYIRIAPRQALLPVSRTEEVADGVMLDFAEDGQLLGIEILDARRRVPLLATRKLPQAAE
jgi:uncharacterized protein YuzE